MCLERHFAEFKQTDFENKLTFVKKAVLHKNTPTHCKALQVLLCSTTKEMAQKCHLWQKLVKEISKIWKPSYDWMISCRKQSEGINYIVMEEFNLWRILAEVFWAYSVKALKLSSQISATSWLKDSLIKYF